MKHMKRILAGLLSCAMCVMPVEMTSLAQGITALAASPSATGDTINDTASELSLHYDDSPMLMGETREITYDFLGAEEFPVVISDVSDSITWQQDGENQISITATAPGTASLTLSVPDYGIEQEISIPIEGEMVATDAPTELTMGLPFTLYNVPLNAYQSGDIVISIQLGEDCIEFLEEDGADFLQIVGKQPGTAILRFLDKDGSELTFTRDGGGRQNFEGIFNVVEDAGNQTRTRHGSYMIAQEETLQIPFWDPATMTAENAQYKITEGENVIGCDYTPGTDYVTVTGLTPGRAVLSVIADGTAAPCEIIIWVTAPDAEDSTDPTEPPTESSTDGPTALVIGKPFTLYEVPMAEYLAGNVNVSIESGDDCAELVTDETADYVRIIGTKPGYVVLRLSDKTGKPLSVTDAYGNVKSGAVFEIVEEPAEGTRTNNSSYTMALNESRRIHFWDPATMTAENAEINVTFGDFRLEYTYTPGTDYVDVTAVGSGTAIMEILAEGCTAPCQIRFYIEEDPTPVFTDPTEPDTGGTMTTTTVIADYATAFDCDNAPMQIGETRAVRVYDPAGNTVSHVKIYECSDNISIDYEDGSDTFYITALAAGDAKVTAWSQTTAFSGYLYLTVLDADSSAVTTTTRVSTVTSGVTTGTTTTIQTPEPSETSYTLEADIQTLVQGTWDSMLVGERRAFQVYCYVPTDLPGLGGAETRVSGDIRYGGISDNIRAEYTPGEDTLYITALEPGEAKLYVCEAEATLGHWITLEIVDEVGTTSPPAFTGTTTSTTTTTTHGTVTGSSTARLETTSTIPTYFTTETTARSSTTTAVDGDGTGAATQPTEEVATETIAAPYFRGDVNGDTIVNAADSVDILIDAAEYGASQTHHLSEQALSAADANGDGVINALDATILLIYAACVGAEPSTPDYPTYFEQRTAAPPEQFAFKYYHQGIDIVYRGLTGTPASQAHCFYVLTSPEEQRSFLNSASDIEFWLDETSYPISDFLAEYDFDWYQTHDLILLVASDYETDITYSVSSVTADADNNWTVRIDRRIPEASGQTISGHLLVIESNKGVEFAKSLTAEFNDVTDTEVPTEPWMPEDPYGTAHHLYGAQCLYDGGASLVEELAPYMDTAYSTGSARIKLLSSAEDLAKFSSYVGDRARFTKIADSVEQSPISAFTAQYDEEWFQTHDLIAVVNIEPQTHNLYSVTDLTVDEAGCWTVQIRRFIPQTSGQSMPCWLVLVETGKDAELSASLDVCINDVYEGEIPVYDVRYNSTGVVRDDMSPAVFTDRLSLLNYFAGDPLTDTVDNVWLGIGDATLDEILSRYTDEFFSNKSVIVLPVSAPFWSAWYRLERMYRTYNDEIAIDLTLINETPGETITMWYMFIETARTVTAADTVNVKPPVTGIEPEDAAFRTSYAVRAEDPLDPEKAITVLTSFDGLTDFVASQSEGNAAALADITARYPEEYFRNHALIVLQLAEPSGSYRMYVPGVTVGDDGSYQISVTTYAPLIADAEESYWYLFVGTNPAAADAPEIRFDETVAYMNIADVGA